MAPKHANHELMVVAFSHLPCDSLFQQSRHPTVAKISFRSHLPCDSLFQQSRHPTVAKISFRTCGVSEPGTMTSLWSANINSRSGGLGASLAFTFYHSARSARMSSVSCGAQSPTDMVLRASCIRLKCGTPSIVDALPRLRSMVATQQPNSTITDDAPFMCGSCCDLEYLQCCPQNERLPDDSSVESINPLGMISDPSLLQRRLFNHPQKWREAAHPRNPAKARLHSWGNSNTPQVACSLLAKRMPVGH